MSTGVVANTPQMWSTRWLNNSLHLQIPPFCTAEQEYITGIVGEEETTSTTCSLLNELKMQTSKDA